MPARERVPTRASEPARASERMHGHGHVHGWPVRGGRPRRGPRRVLDGDGGFVTAETAVALPVLVAFAMALVWGLLVMSAQIRCVDAARAGARAAARQDPADAVLSVARATAPRGADVTVSREGDQVRVVVVAKPPALRGLPFEVREEAVAEAEEASATAADGLTAVQGRGAGQIPGQGAGASAGAAAGARPVSGQGSGQGSGWGPGHSSRPGSASGSVPDQEHEQEPGSGWGSGSGTAAAEVGSGVGAASGAGAGP